jgi:hypothetical protein
MGRAIRLEREKQNGDLGEVLAERSTAALMQGCLHTTQKPFGIALDTADFVRRVPGLAPRALSGFIWGPPRPGRTYGPTLY